MEQQTQAMRSMFAMLRARARASITTGREGTRFVSLQHQKQTGNSKLGLSSCRESHRQKEARRKAVCILRKAVLAPVFWGADRGRPFCTGTTFPEILLDDQGSLEVTLAQPTGCNHQCYNENREEGKKEGRKEGGRTKKG